MLDELPTLEVAGAARSRIQLNLTVPELPEVVQLLTRRLKALDLGCGNGVNALVLAELGFSTTAVDASPERVGALQRAARDHTLPLRAVRADPHLYPLRGMYDVIVAHDCFHRVPLGEQQARIRTLQRHTRRGGFNVLVAVNGGAESMQIQQPQARSDGPPLLALYNRWRVLVSQSYSTQSSATREGEFACHIEKLIAQRP